MKVFKAYIMYRGLSVVLYTDGTLCFVTTYHGGLHYDVALEQGNTRIEISTSGQGEN